MCFSTAVDCGSILAPTTWFVDMHCSAIVFGTKVDSRAIFLISLTAVVDVWSQSIVNLPLVAIIIVHRPIVLSSAPWWGVGCNQVLSRAKYWERHNSLVCHIVTNAYPSNFKMKHCRFFWHLNKCMAMKPVWWNFAIQLMLASVENVQYFLLYYIKWVGLWLSVFILLPFL